MNILMLLIFNWGSLWFTGHILFALLFKGCYHIGMEFETIEKCMAYKTDKIND